MPHGVVTRLVLQRRDVLLAQLDPVVQALSDDVGAGQRERGIEDVEADDVRPRVARATAMAANRCRCRHRGSGRRRFPCVRPARRAGPPPRRRRRRRPSTAVRCPAAGPRRPGPMTQLVPAARPAPWPGAGRLASIRRRVRRPGRPLRLRRPPPPRSSQQAADRGIGVDPLRLEAHVRGQRGEPVDRHAQLTALPSAPSMPCHDLLVPS